MFNIKYYKFFNPDLNNLNNIQISNHWNIMGKKENRVYSIDTFMSKYPNFNIKKYRGFNNDIKNLDDIELMVHYHLKGINENRIFTNDQFYNLYPNFNIDQYKKFIKNIKLLSDDDYIYKWHNEYNNIINSYNKYLEEKNYIIDDFVNDNKIIIDNIDELNNNDSKNDDSNNDDSKNDDNSEKNKNHLNILKNDIITFILVSKNINKTLNTVKSLINLNSDNWKLIIITNICNINNDEILKNDKIEIIYNYVYSSLNSILYEKIKSNNWISILIEGIFLNKNYLSNFYTDLLENNNYDVIIYHYYINESIIIPNKNLDNIINIYVFNKNIIKDDSYMLYYLNNIQSNNDDFINNLIYKKYNIILSKYINYFYNNTQLVLKNEIKQKKCVKFNCNNTFLQIFINLICLLNDYDKDEIFLEKNQIKYNILNINNNIETQNIIPIIIESNKIIDFNLFHKNVFIIKSLLNKEYINESYDKLLNYINPFKKTILIQINDDFEEYENFYINAISFLNFITMNIVVINNTEKKYKFINSLNPSIIIENNDIDLFFIPFHCNYIISTYDLMLYLSYYYGNSSKIFLPKNQYNNLLLYKDVIYVNNEIYNNNNNLINIYKNDKIQNDKYILNNILINNLYVNQYILKHFNKKNKDEKVLSNNIISNNIISNNIISKKINVILFIDKDYNEKQIYNVLNQAYMYYNVFLFIIDDLINVDFKKIFANKTFYIIKNNSINKLIEFLNIITTKDEYLLFINNNVYINNYDFLYNINKRILNTNNNILFKNYDKNYHKIFISNKNILSQNILINNFNDLLNIILDNEIYEICNNYVITLDDIYYVKSNENKYITQNKNEYENINYQYMCYYESNIENKIKIFFSEECNDNKIDKLNLLLFQYYIKQNNTIIQYDNKLNNSNKYYIFLYNTDVSLLNKYKNVFEYCKIGIILVLDNKLRSQKYEEFNNILIYYFKDTNNASIYSIYNIIFKSIEKYNFEYLILFNDDLKYDLDINVLHSINKNIINYNNYIIIKKNIFINYGYLDDISYKKENVMNYLMCKHGVYTLKKENNNDDLFISFYNINDNKNIFHHCIRNRYNTFLTNIKTYFINLDLREDRYIHCINECNKVNITHLEKFSALKPTIDDVKACPLIDVNKMWKRDDKYLIGATGCKISHYNLLKKALLENEDYKYILVLEDDVCFDEFSVQYINFTLEYIEKNNIDFDILYLSVNLKNKEDAEKIDDSLLKIKKGLTTTGQIFQTKKLEKIIKSIERSKTEIDNTYQDMLENKYCVYPMCVYQKNFYSDINSKNMDYGEFHRNFIF